MTRRLYQVAGVLVAALLLQSSMAELHVLPTMTLTSAYAQAPVVRVSAQTACSNCKISLTRVATLGRRSDSILLTERSRIVADGRGRFFATGADGYRVLVYGASGQLQAIVGKKGNGPGEFALPGLQLAIGAGDSLFVLSFLSLNVFSPSFVWARRQTVPDNYAFAPMADNSIVVLGRRGDASATDKNARLPFQLVGHGRSPIAFGPSTLNPTSCSYCFLFTMTPSSDGKSVWTSPPAEYGLTRYRNATAVERIVFEGSSWFLPWNPQQDYPRGLFVTRVLEMREDRSGILWIRGHIPGDSTRVPPGRITSSSRQELMDGAVTVLEAYDSGKKQIVASTRLPHRFVQLVGNDLVAVRRDDADGYVYWEILRADVTRN